MPKKIMKDDHVDQFRNESKNHEIVLSLYESTKSDTTFCNPLVSLTTTTLCISILYSKLYFKNVRILIPELIDRVHVRRVAENQAYLTLIQKNVMILIAATFVLL